VVVFRTFSKIYGLAGLRVGYGITKPDFVANMNKLREPFNVNSLAQAAACGALEDEYFIKKGRTINSEGKSILYEGMKKLGLFFIPSESNFIFADMGVDMKYLFPELLKKGIIIRPGTPWGYPNWARITVGMPEENRILIKELGQILGGRAI
jgi:histidinol-phosphate aminotransferase